MKKIAFYLNLNKKPEPEPPLGPDLWKKTAAFARAGKGKAQVGPINLPDVLRISYRLLSSVMAVPHSARMDNFSRIAG